MGFVAGISAYEGILKIAKLEVISQAKIVELKKSKSTEAVEPESEVNVLGHEYLRLEKKTVHVYQFEIFYKYYGKERMSLIYAIQPKGEPYVALQMKGWPPTDVRSIPLKERTKTIKSDPVYIGDIKTHPEQKEYYFYPVLIKTDAISSLYHNIPRVNQICTLDSLNSIFNFVKKKSYVVLPKQGYLVDFKEISTSTKIERSSFDFMYEDFFEEGGIITLSSPPVYKYMIEGEINKIKELEKLGNTSSLEEISDLNNYGVIHLSKPDKFGEEVFKYLIKTDEEYTGIGEALVLEMISKLFLITSKKSNLIKITPSRLLPRNEESNVILLGGWISNLYSTEILNSESKKWGEYKKSIPFRISDGIVFRANGEEKKELICQPEYSRKESGILSLTRDCAIITKVYGYLYGKTKIICSGIHSEGTQAAGYIISNIETTNGKYKIHELEDYLKEAFDNEIPKWFQVVIRIRVADGVPGVEGIEYMKVAKIEKGKEPIIRP